jgi:hypothetical protein
MAILALGLLISVLPKLIAPPGAPIDAYRAPLGRVFGQADAIAAALDSRFAESHMRVTIINNFLTGDGPLVHNYDAYRVLLHERLRRAQLIIDGWELGTFSPNWQPELAAHRSSPQTLFLLQEASSALGTDNAPQRASTSVWEFFQKLRTANPTCFEQLAEPIELPNVGQQQVFLLSDAPECRTAVFGPS